MKSLYFQTVGIECKFYENQQLEYRLYSWGRSMFEKSFLQIVTHILQKAFFKHALKHNDTKMRQNTLCKLYLLSQQPSASHAGMNLVTSLA